VTGGRPEDAWALVNLLHDRFPKARFRFLWVIHADEFDPRPLDPALAMDPIFSRYFPPTVVAVQRAYDLHVAMVYDVFQHSRLFAADGMVLHDLFDSRHRYPYSDARAVRQNIVQELMLYRSRPAGLSQRSVRYFRDTLLLMARLGVGEPLIVAAPLDPRICRATVDRGWGARHRLLLAVLDSLDGTYRFDFIDFSRGASCGCTAGDFYDGIHLRPEGAQKVFDAVLNRFPGAFE
jgi:hypothetical protein